MKKLIMIATVLVLGFTGVNAQKSSKHYPGRDYRSDNFKNARVEHRVNSFQREARENIAYGIINGTITAREAKVLLEAAERIEIKENRFLRNGRLTSRESNELQRDLASLNRAIEREKRDNDKAYVDNYNGRNRSRSW